MFNPDFGNIHEADIFNLKIVKDKQCFMVAQHGHSDPIAQ